MSQPKDILTRLLFLTGVEPAELGAALTPPVKPATISGWCRGNRSPSWRYLKQVTRFFNAQPMIVKCKIPVEKMLLGTEPKDK